MPSWYALHVSPSSESRVSRKLGEVGIESYYPSRMVDSKRLYRPQIELKYFPGYVFAHFELSDRTPVVSISQVIQILGTAHSPCAIPDLQIEAIRAMTLSATASLSSGPMCGPGQAVIIQRGPLRGLEGIVIRSKGKTHLVVNIGAIGRSLSAEIAVEDCTVNSSVAH